MRALALVLLVSCAGHVRAANDALAFGQATAVVLTDRCQGEVPPELDKACRDAIDVFEAHDAAWKALVALEQGDGPSADRDAAETRLRAAGEALRRAVATVEAAP